VKDALLSLSPSFGSFGFDLIAKIKNRVADCDLDDVTLGNPVILVSIISLKTRGFPPLDFSRFDFLVVLF
jgi:hypothetical protein